MTMELAERAADCKRAVDRRLPGPVRLGPLTLTVHSRRGLPWVDRVAEWDGWDRYHDAGVAALLAVQVGVVVLFGLTARAALTGKMGSTPANDPANAIAIPGVNEFMPLAAGGYVLVGLVVATGIHELGHAVACRREGIRIEEWGAVFLLGVIPVAGYVLPDEDELEAAPDRGRLRVFSVGVFNNLLLAIVALSALALPVTGSGFAAYMTYFGWALTGGAAPTAASIAALGVGTNVLFWTAFLSANVALMNALPVGILDGGRVLSILAEDWTRRLSVPDWTSTAAVRVVGACTTLVVGVAVFGPHLH